MNSALPYTAGLPNVQSTLWVTGESYTATYHYQHAQYEPWHSHHEAQLTYTSQGALQIHTAHGIWSLPPYRALWIPAGFPHETHALGDATAHNLYLREDKGERRVQEFSSLPVSRLMHDVITSPVLQRREPQESQSDTRRATLMASLLLHELSIVQSAPVGFLPTPRERRLRAFVAYLMQDGNINHSLESLSLSVEMTPRTLSRLFMRDTGLTFVQWRHQHQLMEAIGLMAQEYSIEHIADRLGYFSGSTFITMFRKALGDTPLRYFRAS